jgi:hypothetical protein
MVSNTNSPTAALVYKLFAAPGIDSGVDEYGINNSGAGRHPDAKTTKAAPTDWSNESPVQNHATGRLVGNYSATQAPNAKSMAIRRRGLAPFGGFFPGKRSGLSMQHPGGIVDHNAGADHLIAGGTGQASSMCRVNVIGRKSDAGMKLPVMPSTITRGGISAIPSGGGSHEPLTAPLQPKVSGWASIFAFRKAGATA